MPQIALVSQNPVLFSGSLRYNIRYGLKDCGTETLKKAVTEANAANLIPELESDWESPSSAIVTQMLQHLGSCLL